MSIEEIQEKENKEEMERQGTDRIDSFRTKSQQSLAKSCNINSCNKTTIAKQILSVIRNDDFEELLIILRSKPDLNVFINGQTALHYCLLLGKNSIQS